MSVRVDVAPSVLTWALDTTGTGTEALRRRFQVTEWLSGGSRPTLNQLQRFAKAAGIPFGYLLLPQPPAWRLPIPDFREGLDDAPPPSTDLMAVLGQSRRRQEWYRGYALGLGAGSLSLSKGPLHFVGSAAELGPMETAARIRAALGFEVANRRGTLAETRKSLLRKFEALGGLTVATSMVDNNAHRPLNEHEFSGFALVDDIAPLVFVNTRQTLHGQIFTLAHEYAHVWRGVGGLGNENLRSEGEDEIERWSNAVASEILAPRDELAARHARVAGLPLTDALDALAREFRCGTLVVLHALHRTGVRQIDDYTAAYDAEAARLRSLTRARVGRGGNHYNVLPFRVGERLSRALIADTMEGRTPVSEAMRLMSMQSASTFDQYARRLGVA